MNNESNITKCIENLAPVTDGENQEIYIELLKKGINDKKVKNIALSGSYGSGKSSIIQKFLSLLSKNEKDKYIEISLANFDNNITKGDEENHIEKSILQQIFYKVSKNELPYSKLERTEKKSESSIVGNSIAFFIWLVSFLIFIKATDIKKWLIDMFNIQDINIQTIVILFSIIPLLVSTFYIIYITVKGTGKIKLNKLSFQGTTLEIDKKQGSLINQHLDEILYFFEATSYEVLIIEDLDRQDGTKIFQKLREINILLNNYTKINNKKKITFIYAVKDSIFTGEERTKFFELIIPVVPIINTSNAKDILIQKFNDIGIMDKLEIDFLKDISYYIQNYRQLTNIVNEFCVYQEALINTQDHKKLFALIAYKNFFPKDFSDLQNRKGMLYDILHSKKLEIRNKLIEELNYKVSSIDKRLIGIEEENLDNERELKLIFASRLFDEVDDLLSFYNGSSVTIVELVDDEKMFKNYVIDGGNLNYYYKSNPSYTNSNNFKGDESGEYEKRLKILRDKVLEKEKKISKEKETLQNEIREIKYEKLLKLLENVDDKSLLDIENLTEEDKGNWKLIKKMIIDGYLDEDYSRYISYFHEGELTRNDYDFIAKIKDDDYLDFAYTLDNVKEVIDELSINDFKNNIENLAVAEYIFEIDTIIDKRKYFVDNFFEKSSETFIRELLEKNLKNKSLISTILKEAGKKVKLHKLFDILKTENNSIKQLLLSTIDDLNNIDLSSKDKEEFNNLLSNFLFNIYDEIKDKKTIEKYLLDEQIIFDELTDLKYKYSKELFEFIYKNSLHDLTYENTKSILVNLFDFKISEEIKLKTANLTTLRENKAKELHDDINKNIDLYFEDCWSKLDENTKESEETLLYLLNHDDFKDGYKIEVIKKVETKIEDITTVEDKELWHALFTENKINANWDNLLHHYLNNEEKIVDEVVEFLNIEKNYIKLSKTQINNEQDFDKDTILQDFNRKILLSENISDKAYSYLIKSTWFVGYKILSFENLSSFKINCILEQNKLTLTQNNIDKLKENFLPKHIILLENLKDEFLEKIDEFSLDADDIFKILNSSKFTNEEKVKTIESIDISLFENSQKLKEHVSKLYIDLCIEIENISLFEILFYGENQYNLKLLVSQIKYWGDCSFIETYLNELDKPYNELLEKNANKLYLENKKINKLLLEELEKKDCISSFREHKGVLGKKEFKVERKRV